MLFRSNGMQRTVFETAMLAKFHFSDYCSELKALSDGSG